MTALFTTAVVIHARNGDADTWLMVVIGVLAAIGSSQLALALVNFMATRLAHPHPLPRLDFSQGIPSDGGAMVVVPSLIYTPDNIDTLAETLEVRYLANRDPKLRFCLLTDFTDAPRQEMPGDAELAEQARAAIAALNVRYGFDDVVEGFDEDEVAQTSTVRIEPFILLHRPRIWNESEQAWIGRERKRGKLEDLNLFLRGGARERFSLVEGSTEGLENIRYVITLDADTQLPRDAARQFIATMAHPLNQPKLDPTGSRVIEGYGILQPRVSTSLPHENASRYEHLCGGEPGIDPYTRTVSDVYQDLFGEGSFVGKGIYEVDTFEHVLGGRLPDNKVLSHDLLEGCYLRAGLLSDAQLYESYPGKYSDDVSRRHRWIRGDWQLAGWLRGTVPGVEGKRQPNRLSALSRWKLFDNLRRSLVAPALTVLLILCWSMLMAPAFWSAAILSVFLLPAIIGTLIGLVDKGHDMPWEQHLTNWSEGASTSFGNALMDLAFMPHQAWYSMDAIVRTAWRMTASHRHLLEWRASTLSRSSTDMESNIRTMWFAPALAIGTAILLSFVNPYALFPAAPLLLLWFLSPVLSWWLSRPIERVTHQLSGEQTLFLHVLARRTWNFFENFVGAEDNWLPPDNMQEHPSAVVAHRTSPTNMGMALLANLTAWDFGYIAGAELLRRTSDTLDTMGKMEQYRGHWYNWYDTRTLEPLMPKYVSAVDSGNLAGHLITLAAGLRQLSDRAIVGPQLLDGIRDTLDVLEGHATAQVIVAAPGHRYLARLCRQPRSTGAPGRCHRGSHSCQRRRVPARVEQPPGHAMRRGQNRTVDARAVDARGPGTRDRFEPHAHSDAAGTGRLHASVQHRERSGAGRAPAPAGAGAIDCRRHRRSARAHRLPAGTRSAGHRLRPHGDGLPVCGRSETARDWLQRHRSPPRQQHLRSARVRSAPGQLCRHRPRPAAAGTLVRARPHAVPGGRRAGAAIVERLDVRVPDAAAGDANLQQHAARANLSWHHPRAGRLRPQAQRPVGHFRIRLQHHRRVDELPVPRVRRAGHRPETRPGG
jgi:cyclic beta-1,2-glucan synthetase